MQYKIYRVEKTIDDFTTILEKKWKGDSKYRHQNVTSLTEILEKLSSTAYLTPHINQGSLSNFLKHPDFIHSEMCKSILTEILRNENSPGLTHLLIENTSNSKSLKLETYSHAFISSDLPYYIIIYNDDSQNYRLVDKESLVLLPFHFHDLLASEKRGVLNGRHNTHNLYQYDFCEIIFDSELLPDPQKIESFISVRHIDQNNYKQIWPINTNVDLIHVKVKEHFDIAFQQVAHNILNELTERYRNKKPINESPEYDNPTDFNLEDLEF